MDEIDSQKGYDRPVEIAAGIYWVGFHNPESNFHCNPYLVTEGDEAALIDAGSRPDFPVVMTKILQTGITPNQVKVLVYQHFDPDLCGSMPNMIDICDNPEMIVLSEMSNIPFISHYLEREEQSTLRAIDDYGFSYRFGDRRLQFHKTPYAHSAGSFVTYDERTKTLFSSDLFGSFSQQWSLFAELDGGCYKCTDYRRCPLGKAYCPLPDFLEFHRQVMPSEKALRYAMAVLGKLDIEMIAPQHGSIFRKKEDIAFLIKKLAELRGVGIDAYQ